MNGGYVLIDFKGITLIQAQRKKVLGIYKKIDDAYKIGKQIRFTNLHYYSDDEESYTDTDITPMISKEIGSENYNIYFAFYGVIVTMAIDKDDNIE